jgi:EAL domain-containing protein (putative c-di-GMP-specific phosphodiesterase class I)
MAVHCSAVQVADDPRVRPSRNVIRGLREAARLVETRETAERLKMIASCRSVLAGRKLHAVFQPVVSIRDQSVVGYEALIRGPQGELERPDVLFAVAQEADMTLELESLCLETIFAKVPRAIMGKKLFVNASPRLLGHSVFLDDRNLEAMRRAHPDVVLEVSEKQVVHDYSAFRETLDRLRQAGLQIAIDDAGSGYSGLESILQLRPEYIKVATSIVRNLHSDTIKRQVITALASLGEQIQAPLIAEGIEQPEELDSLLQLGVRMGQGFLLGRPSARIARANA